MNEFKSQNLENGNTNQSEDKAKDLDNKDPFARLSRLEELGKVQDTSPKEKPAEVKPAVEKPVVEKLEAAKPAEEEFDEIVYMKEKVKIPVKERQTYLQKGYNYDRVKAAADNANAALVRAAQIEGFDRVEDYLNELTIREKNALAEKLEEAAGDPDKLTEIINNHPDVVKTREEKRQLEYQKAKNELRKDIYFNEVEPTFDAIMEMNPTANPELVYKIARSDYLTPQKISELIAKAAESAEKKVTADMHDKERRATPTGGDAEADGKDAVVPSEFTKEIAKIFKVDPSIVAQRAHKRIAK